MVRGHVDQRHFALEAVGVAFLGLIQAGSQGMDNPPLENWSKVSFGFLLASLGNPRQCSTAIASWQLVPVSDRADRALRHFGTPRLVLRPMEYKADVAVVVKTNGSPFWLVGEFTPRFLEPIFSGWIESDVHWGYDLDFDPWAYGYGSKSNHQELDRRFWSMFPLTRASHLGTYF